LTTEEEQALAHTYDVFIYGGRDGKTVKARIRWGNGRQLVRKEQNLPALLKLLGELMENIERSSTGA
jgi:hypothetical protein